MPRTFQKRKTSIRLKKDKDKSRSMKIKILTQSPFEFDYDFETKVNKFMAGVEVIEAKSEAFQDKIAIIHTVSILYKEL